MNRWREFGALVAALAIALAVAAMALLPPRPLPADASSEVFSATRSFADIRQIAARPHPTGSPELIRVRAYLVDRLGVMGMSPTVRSAAAKTLKGEGVLIHDIAGVLPGTDRSKPAIVLMSHYDSVPAGPGAADDAAGVAAALEIARAVKASGPHRRDLIVLITDGEEAGLLGSAAFFKTDPLARRFGVIINMEARGNSGRAVMFETHRGAAPLIAHLNRAGALQGASSLMPDLYRRLPNDTDLTPAQAAGHMGVNFAFFGGFAHYHQPTDTPANLDLGSVQHIGEQAQAAALALLDAEALPPRGPDQAYGDVLGGPVEQYADAVGWALVGLCLLLIALTWRNAAPRPLAILIGGGQFLLILALPAVLLLVASGLTAGRFSALLSHYPSTLSGYALLTLGGLLGACAAHQRRGPVDPFAPWIAALILGAAVTIVVQAIAPLDGFMLTWPLLAGSAAAALGSARHGALRLLAWPLITLSLAQVFYWAGLMFELIGVDTPLVLAGFAFLVALLALGPALRATSGRPAGLAAGGLVVAGAGLLLWAAIV